MELNIIVIAQCRCDAALRIFGGRLAKTIFGDYKNTARRGEFYRGSKACYSGPDDNEVCANKLNRVRNHFSLQYSAISPFPVQMGA
jgi:hypothetical protein